MDIETVDSILVHALVARRVSEWSELDLMRVTTYVGRSKDGSIPI